VRLLSDVRRPHLPISPSLSGYFMIIFRNVVLLRHKHDPNQALGGDFSLTAAKKATLLWDD
jgi:hypothetical protein